MGNNNYKEITIFLIEDDDVDAIGIERSMRKMNLLNPIERAKDGVEALEKLRSGAVKKPFVILLDLNMPRMGGLEMLEHLREDDTISDAVVFVLTTSRNDEEITRAYKKNIAGYIVKSSLSQDFNKLLSFLNTYWVLVELPR